MKYKEIYPMKLYIAEKPSLGKAISEGLGIVKRCEGYIECQNQCTVTWAVGHLLELSNPDEYDAKYKKWSKQDLPIIPNRWEMKVKGQTRKQFLIVQRLIKEASELVNAGDPDREGSFLIDEIIEYCGATLPTYRVLISDLNPGPVKKALANLKDNSFTKGLSESAKARSRADWLYGMNLTRAYTIAGREKGLNQVLSVGRVQTPLLGLIVRRDLAIEDFTPTPFFGIKGVFQTGSEELIANWQVIAPESTLDEEGRLIDADFANSTLNNMHGRHASVLSVESKRETSRPPLLHSLSELQKDANQAFGYTAQQTLDLAQSLYEVHKVTTYPRSDCRYISTEQWAEGENIIKGLISEFSDLEQHSFQFNFNKKAPAFKSEKVGAHHAIMPTGKKPQSTMSPQERNIFTLIFKQFLAQYLGDRLTDKTQVKIQLESENYTFKSVGAVVVEKGWSVLFKSQKEKLIPSISEGQLLPVKCLSLEEKKTTPPKRFTEASLLDAMTGISKYVKDQSISKVLKETDGLGTEATRAGIIELLIKREFVIREKKNFISTELGRRFIQCLPEQLTWPDMTALWESQLNLVSEHSVSEVEFVSAVSEEVSKLVAATEIKSIESEKASFLCPNCKKTLNRFKKKTGGYFWSCIGYRDSTCSYATDDVKGRPDLTEKKSYPCPQCDNKLVKRMGANGAFWGCLGFKDGCSFTAPDKKNAPDISVSCSKESQEIETCSDCEKPIKRLYSKKNDSYFWMHQTEDPNCHKYIPDAKVNKSVAN